MLLKPGKAFECHTHPKSRGGTYKQYSENIVIGLFWKYQKFRIRIFW